MAEHERETMDEYGLRLGRELNVLSSSALRPYDAAAIAREVALTHPRRPGRPVVRALLPVALPLGRPRLRLVAVTLATITLLLGLLNVALVPGGTEPVPVSDRGEIAFVSATYTCADGPCVLRTGSDRMFGLRAESPTVVSVSGDGDEPMPLVDVPGTSHRPTGWTVLDPRSSWLAGPAVRWSPDGSRLAFRLFNDEPGIYVVNRDGSGLSRVVDLSLDHDSGMASAGLAWSPDGSRIAYTYPYGGMQSPLYVVDTADGRVTALGVMATRAMAWSPDGSRIAFVQSDRLNANGANVSGLVVMDADGSDVTLPYRVRLGLQTPLADTFVDDYHVGAIAWSPDGSRIAFALSGDSRSTTQGRPDRSGLYSIAPDGTSLQMLTEPNAPPVGESGAGCCIHIGGTGELAWSPDGSRVAAVAPPFHSGIVVANADGSGASRFGPPTAYAIDWAPDGSQLVYAAGPPWVNEHDGATTQEVSTDEWSSVYVIGADGTDGRWLASGEYPDWSSGAEA